MENLPSELPVELGDLRFDDVASLSPVLLPLALFALMLWAHHSYCF